MKKVKVSEDKEESIKNKYQQCIDFSSLQYAKGFKEGVEYVLKVYNIEIELGEHS